MGTKVWEHLEQFVAAGFDPKSPLIDKFSGGIEDGGLCLLTAAEKQKVQKLGMKGRPNEEKFVALVAYLFELAYDLALDPRKNVSDSPGFEAFGLFSSD